uniref:Translocation and assembly module subunit TamA n=2 Tax=Candidatus Berkiella cookevillensis TaxID=437022 RepID=A0A0Q9YNT7_9GAMM
MQKFLHMIMIPVFSALKILSSLKFMRKLLLCCLITLTSNTVSAIEPVSLSVKINGVSEDIEKHIRSDMSLQHLRSDPAISESVLEYYIERAIQEITVSLQPYGFYNPHITARKSFKKNRWLISFSVDKGPVVQIETIDIQIEGPGLYNPNLSNIAKLMPLKIGNTLLHEEYEAGKKAILNAAIYEGYLAAELTTHRVEVDTQRSKAKIIIVLNTSNLYYFGHTTFSDSLLNNTFLNRYPTYEEGDPFTAQKLLNLEDALRNSDYFSTVRVDSQPNHETYQVPISVDLEDQKPNHYLFGAGYGTDTGPRGKVGYLRRRVNSKGHKFNAQLQLSELFHKVEADYIIPGKRPQTDSISINSKYMEDEYNEKPVESLELTLSEKREIYGWDRIMGLSFIHEKSVTFISNESRRDDLLLPFIEFKNTTRDNLNNPTRGRTRMIRLKGAHDDLASSVSFAQIYFQERWLHSFAYDFKTLFRLELGATLPRTYDKLPLSQRFFAGGDTSIRGFGYRSLPAEIDKDDERQPVGGSYLFVTSLELGKMIYKPFGIHSFIDMGNAFRSSKDEVQIGIGGGINYDTKLGPIKFSIAKPITNAAQSWRIHATFGPEL